MAEVELRTTALAGDERRLLAALRSGEEWAFAALVDALGASMLRVARLRVSSGAVAEEVVQETWLAVLRGLDGFEGRSSLRTWIISILGNCANKRAQRESRSVPFTSLSVEPVVSPEHFFAPDHPRWPRCWSTLVDGWAAVPEERLLSREVRGVVRTAMAALPAGQREVMTLRDVEGWSSGEVCDFLDLTDANQRVLLHRARAKVREAIRNYLSGEVDSHQRGH